MELIERDGFLDLLRVKFDTLATGEGHCILVSGEAGIGKTSLARAFSREKKDHCTIYQGTCDALFTPRPLAPLYDVLWQMRSDAGNTGEPADRVGLFNRFFQDISVQKGPILMVFEDIHWADEATLDFIKFFARRITHIPCLFILTYRENEIHSGHPLRNVLGQLPPDSFTRLTLLPLSRQAVEKMATEKGYRGEDVYHISGGNPFYVNEILAYYSPGIPDNIKDSILTIYNMLDDRTKQVWNILSVLPTGIEIKYLEKLAPSYASAIANCMDKKILIPQDGQLFFKHELYRRTIEASLSPFVRVELNKRILDLFRESFEENHELERIIHHAKNANEYDLVVHYAPLAARQASTIGAHVEASKLYLSAIEYYQGQDADLLIRLYEAYAYECYLTNRMKDAIIYQGKSLQLRKMQNDPEKTGDCMRFLSRIWWFDGNRKQAESYAGQAIDILKDHPSSRAKAMAFSNMAQLKMLADQPDECVFWGEQAIDMARELGDEEILSHAMNNVGTTLALPPSSRQKGIDLLQQSLELALKTRHQEHVARAYTNQVSIAVKIRDYAAAQTALTAGVQYCEERDLDSWKHYMLSFKARMNLETGHWEEAEELARHLLKYESQAPIIAISALVVVATVGMRRGNEVDVLSLLAEAREKAFVTQELQRIAPVLVAMLEYEWLTGKAVVEKNDLDKVIAMIGQMGQVYENSTFAFWLLKARQQPILLRERDEGYQASSRKEAVKAAARWKQLGCPYEQALLLWEGEESDKKEAIAIVHELGAQAVYEKMKQEMKEAGIKNIPRGIRKATQANPAHLTEREMGVLLLLQEGMANKEIAEKLFVSAKTVDHHISSILFKLDVNSRVKAVQEALRLGILK